MSGLLRGRAFGAGATVGVVAPASGFDSARLQAGTKALQTLGYRVRPGANMALRTGQYFAGTAQQRADDLHAMFADREVAAIICARGGYGSQQMLPLLDLDVVRANPKPIIGCSDVTALQLWLLVQCGLASLHGPMVAGDFARTDGVDMASWNACTQATAQWSVGTGDGLRVLKPGIATGQLWGGCLSLHVSTLATPFELLPRINRPTVLFVEDIGEKPYKIERMFEQWRQAGKLTNVTGIVFGEMLECQQPAASYELEQVVLRMLADFAGPVAFGLRSGHVRSRNVTLPLGVQARLECADGAALTFQQAATEPA